MTDKELIIYTDGACEPNPGPGGYGVVLICGDLRKELSGAYAHTTNNRMELLAVIIALQSLDNPPAVTLHSDSKYVVDALNQGWARKWRSDGWVRKGAKRIPNSDLWKRLLDLDDKYDVEYKWVKGHSGNEFNERADALSYQAIERLDKREDKGYLIQVEEEKERPLKITKEGQPCRKCSTPVVKRKPQLRNKSGQTYYYEYYLYCPQCKTMYMVEDAKRHIDQDSMF
jgi:ribonuclease HI